MKRQFIVVPDGESLPRSYDKIAERKRYATVAQAIAATKEAGCSAWVCKVTVERSRDTRWYSTERITRVLGKRAKEVFSTDEVPHIWAHHVQESGRNSQGNLYFNGDTIYSYGSHFPIARHITNKRGQRAVLFTTGSYGNTTSGHKSMVESAIPPTVPVFHLYATDVRGTLQHSKNLKAYRTLIEELLLKSARARSTWAINSASESAAKTRKEMASYIKFFALVSSGDAYALPTLRKPDAAKLKALRAKETETRKEYETQRVADAAQRVIDNAEAIEKWRAGICYNAPYDVPTMLRVEDQELVTSRGARIPLADAAKGYILARHVVETGEAWRANGSKIKLGHYFLDSIAADGTVTAGCHVITWPEIERHAALFEQVRAASTETALSVMQDGETLAPASEIGNPDLEAI